MKTNQIMKNRISVVAKLSSSVGLVALISFLALFVALPTKAQTRSATASPKGKLFASPDEAVNALVDAREKYDENGLKEILGPDSYDLIHTGEPVQDKEIVTKFASMARAKQSVSYDPRKTRAFLSIGDDGWPFPIPMVKQGTKWYFDTAAGR